MVDRTVLHMHRQLQPEEMTLSGTGSRMTVKMKDFFLDMHNQIRREVALGEIEGQPSASDMNELVSCSIQLFCGHSLESNHDV
ncbi:unnamed protein product [Protopolystoma xenopodis]|uniref:SCP domain-containing protein n=1 Tax=Protopolystoma xenopodis TaxID=117903 RepID=A0A448XE61_9PLAT|nr:unnamed protein product [Protopolystoma xenopodis]